MDMWSGHPSDYGMLRIFGCVTYPHDKQGKLEPRAVKCVLLGHPGGVKGYRLYRLDDEPPKIVTSRNVVFNESVIYKDTLKDSGASDKSVEELQPSGLIDYQLVRDREPRTRMKPLRFRDESNMAAYAFVVAEKEDTHELLTYQEAVACESPRQWYKRFNEYMLNNRFKRSSYNRCVYYRSYAQGEYIYLLLYVDDMLIACKSRAEIWSTKSLIKKEFDMKELEEAKKIFGMEIVREQSRKIPRVSQFGYVSKILNNFKTDNKKSVKMTLGGHLKLSLKDCPVRDCDVKRISKIFGESGQKSLGRSEMYFEIFAGHCKRGFGVWKNRGNHVDVTAFVDSYYAKDPDKGRDSLIAKSCFHERTKHVNVRYHFIREVLKAKTVKVLKVGTEHNVADALTKMDSNELFQKILDDLKEVAEYVNSPSRDHLIFFDDNEDHYVQYTEYLGNSSNEIAASNSNQEKEGPPQDSDIRQLIREDCCIEVCEEQKQNMEDMILELVEIYRQKELYCMHDNVDDLIESVLNSKLLSINFNSQRLNKEKQEVKNIIEQPAERRTRIEKSLQNFRVINKNSTSLKNTSQISPVHAVAPILSTKEPEYSPSMGYEHPNITPKKESDEKIKSGVEELVPIPNENEVTSEDKKECDVPVFQNSPICDDHYEIFSDSNNDDDISSDDDAFEDIEYVEASLLDPEIVSVEEENVVYQEEEEVDLKDISQIQDVILREKLLSINHLITNIESLNDNPTPDHVLNSSVSFPISEEREVVAPLLMIMTVFPSMIRFALRLSPIRREETDLFLAFDNSIPPGIENFAYDSEGDIRFLKELLIDDSIPNNESSESNFDNPSFPRPPPEPPDAEFDFEEEISVVMNTIIEFECLNQRDEFDVSNDEDDDYFHFIRIFLTYLICSKKFLFFSPLRVRTPFLTL
nr:hypothetical protein [Tanacetum cinerariifolium]